MSPVTAPTVGATGGAKGGRASFDAWFTLAVLFGLYTLSFADRYVITILVPDIKAALKLTDTQMGVILGPAFVVCYSVFALPLGWLADRYSRRWVIFLGVAAFSLATAGSGLAQSFTAMVAARMCIGIGEAALSPPAYSLMADKFPRHLFGTASAIYNTAAKLGVASAYSLAGAALLLAARLPIPGLPQGTEPWRGVFVLVGALTLALNLLVFLFREPPRPVASRNLESGAPGSILGFVKDQRAVLLPLLLGFSLVAIASFALTSWGPTYITRRFHWTPAQYGPVLGAVSMAAALSLIFKGMIIDWLYARGGKDAYVRFYTWLLLASLPVALAAFFIPDPVAFIVCLGIIQVVAIPTIVYLAPTLQLIVPGHLRGQVIAVALFVLTVIGGSLGPMCVALLTDKVFHDEAKIGYAIGIVVCASLPLAFILLRLALTPLRAAVLAAEAGRAADGGAR